MAPKSILLAGFIALAGIASVAAVAPQAIAQQAAQSQIVVIDMDRFRSQSTAYADMQTKLRTLLDQKQNEFRTQNQAAVQQAETESRALQPLIRGKTIEQIRADAALNTRVEAQARREQDLAQKQQLFQLSAQQTAGRAEQELLRALDPVITQIMTQRGAVVVMERAGVAKASPSVDITQDAVTRFNAQTRTATVTWSPVTAQTAPAGQQK